MSGLRTREICLSWYLRVLRCGGVTLNHRHNACWLLLSTPEILPLFRPEKTASNSLLSKILPITLTRSRFCGHSTKINPCFQDFSYTPGGGGIPSLAPRPRQSCSAEGYYSSINDRAGSSRLTFRSSRALSGVFKQVRDSHRTTSPDAARTFPVPPELTTLSFFAVAPAISHSHVTCFLVCLHAADKMEAGGSHALGTAPVRCHCRLLSIVAFTRKFLITNASAFHTTASGDHHGNNREASSGNDRVVCQPAF